MHKLKCYVFINILCRIREKKGLKGYFTFPHKNMLKPHLLNEFKYQFNVSFIIQNFDLDPPPSLLGGQGVMRTGHFSRPGPKTSYW